MFSIFNRSKRVTNLEWLGVDIHSHLLPGIDDGAPDVKTSIELIKGLKELGFSKLICTPHIYKELYPNTTKSILTALEVTQIAVEAEGLGISVLAAAEHMIDDSFEVNDDLLCLPDRHILIEMSYLFEAPGIEKTIFDLQVKGYKVILAHPERYVFYRDLAKYQRLKEMGVFFQLNLLSVMGGYGKEVKKITDELLVEGLYDFAATDLHHLKQLDMLSNTVANGSLHQKIGNYPFRNKQVFD